MTHRRLIDEGIRKVATRRQGEWKAAAGSPPDTGALPGPAICQLRLVAGGWVRQLPGHRPGRAKGAVTTATSAVAMHLENTVESSS